MYMNIYIYIYIYYILSITNIYNIYTHILFPVTGIIVINVTKIGNFHFCSPKPKFIGFISWFPRAINQPIKNKYISTPNKKIKSSMSQIYMVVVINHLAL